MTKANISLSICFIAMTGLIWFSIPYVTSEQKQALSPLKVAQKVKKSPSKALSHQHPIEQYHLFGKEVGMAKTSVNISLKGILTNDEGISQGAVIAVGSKPERLYREGQKLSNGYKLDKIYPRKVTLTYKGKTSVIKLIRKKTINTSKRPKANPNYKDIPTHWRNQLQHQ